MSPKPRIMSVFDRKAELVSRLIFAKEASGLTFDQIAAHLGLTNVYTSHIFMNQCQLKPATAAKLAEIVPILPDDLLLMQVRN